MMELMGMMAQTGMMELMGMELRSLELVLELRMIAAMGMTALD